MIWWIWTIIKIYTGIHVVGFIITFVLHALFLQMVTPSLALLRAAVWPVFLMTGWPHGVPLTMD